MNMNNQVIDNQTSDCVRLRSDVADSSALASTPESKPAAAPEAGATHTQPHRTAHQHGVDIWALIAALLIVAPAAWGDYVRRVFGTGNGGDTWRLSPWYWPVTALWTIALIAALYLALHWLFRSLNRANARLSAGFASNATDCESTTIGSKKASTTPSTISMTTAEADAISNTDESPEPSLQSSNHRRFSRLRHFRARHPFCAQFVFICACWLPYVIIRFPGNLDPDTQWQLLQYYGLAARTDQHPWFDTLVFGTVWRLGGALGSYAWALFLYEIAQMACTACTFALCVHWMRRIGIPRRIQRFTLLFAALYPVVPLFAQTMAKDMLFGWPYVLFLLCLAEAARTHGAAFASRRFAAAFFAVMCLMMLTKKTGIYIALGSCAVLVAYIWWWQRRERRGAAHSRTSSRALPRAVAIMIAAILLIGGIWQHAAIPAMGIAPSPSKERMSVVTQSTALYVRWHGAEMSDSDWEIVHSVFKDAQDLSTVYDPYRADATKDRWISDAPSAAKQRFLRWYAGVMLRNPGMFFISWAANTLPLIYPDTTTQGDESYVSYRNNLPQRPGAGNSDATGGSTANSTVSDAADSGTASTAADPIGNENFLVGMTGDTSAASLARVQSLMRSAYRPAWAARIADGFDAVYAWLEHYAPVLFIKATFTTWIPLICAAYCLRRRSGLGLVMLVPTFITLATLAAAPIVLPRYLVASVYALPMVLAATATNPSKDRALR